MTDQHAMISRSDRLDSDPPAGESRLAPDALAAAVVTSEEMNEADEVYAAELAGMRSSEPPDALAENLVNGDQSDTLAGDDGAADELTTGDIPSDISPVGSSGDISPDGISAEENAADELVVDAIAADDIVAIEPKTTAADELTVDDSAVERTAADSAIDRAAAEDAAVDEAAVDAITTDQPAVEVDVIDATAADGADTPEAGTAEADTAEADTAEADTAEADTAEADTPEADAREATGLDDDTPEVAVRPGADTASTPDAGSPTDSQLAADSTQPDSTQQDSTQPDRTQSIDASPLTESAQGADSQPVHTSATVAAPSPTGTARVTPDPRPRPRPTPAGRPGSTSRTQSRAAANAPTLPLIPEPSPEASDPTPWGRVDDDGTVFVLTADGERAVGFWQAGDAAAGLAHYGRRFDDFVTEVVVLETRLGAGSGDPKAIRTHAQMLRQSIDTLPAVGDLATAAARLDAVVTAAEGALAAVSAERAALRVQAVARREALCAEAEALAESNQWKLGGDRLKEIVEEWRTIRGLDRKTDDLLWKRFSKARDLFIRRRGSHFAELDKERGAVKDAKETLIATAEELADSTDWGATANRYRSLMTEWKAIGRTSRDVEDALWHRFRDAQERFFSRRQETFASRDAEFEGNAKAKEALLREAERIDPASGLDAAKAALRALQARWEEIGKVPRERIRSLDGRLKAIEDRIKSAEDSHWRRTDPEAAARLAQFRSRFETYQAQADKATAAGDAKRAAAAQAQADQWLEWLRAAENAVD